MKFELIKPKNQKIDSDELIKDLIAVSLKIGKAPTMSEYNANGRYENSVYIRRFGSWNKALQIAGLTINNRQYSELELLQNLQNVWIKLGKQPARRDMDNKLLSTISSGAYLRFYSTWSNALKAFILFIEDNELSGSSISTFRENEITHKTSRDVNLRLRFLVMKRDNFKCCNCGRSPTTTQGLELHIDHIKPWAKGGETVLENLQTLCSDCNLGKSDIE